MIDLTALKKLSTEEKLKIIGELEASIEWTEDELKSDSKLLEEMERRYQDMLSRKDKGYSWEEAEAIWRKTSQTLPVHD